MRLAAANAWRRDGTPLPAQLEAPYETCGGPCGLGGSVETHICRLVAPADAEGKSQN